MNLPSGLIPYLGVAAVLGLVFFWFLERERRRQLASFRSSSQFLALGLPAVPLHPGDSHVERSKVIAEFRRIGDDYRRYSRAIEAARSDFFLSNGIQLSDPRGGSRYISQPSRLLTCDVILGEPLAAADLGPGSAIYWQRVSGLEMEEAVTADPTIAADLLNGNPRTIIAGDFRIELRLDGARLMDLRPDGLVEIRLERGTPMLLSLDDESERVLVEAFGEEAPPKGSSRKVRLFGGFQVDETGRCLEVIPYRQQPGMTVAAKGRLHPLSSLLGIVVAEAKDRAFVWAAPAIPSHGASAEVPASSGMPTPVALVH